MAKEGNNKHALHIPVSEHELDAIKETIRRSGITRPSFIRQAIYNALPKDVLEELIKKQEPRGK